MTFYGADLARVHDEGYTDLARAAAARLVAELSAAGLTSGTVVDLGCGSGVLSAAVASEGYEPYGVDLSPAMLALARERIPQGTFVEGAIADVEIPPAVAVAAIGEVVNYAADPRAGLCVVQALATRAAAALVPGGLLLMDVATPGRGGRTGRREAARTGDGWSIEHSAEESADGATLVRHITVVRDGRRSVEEHALRLLDADRVVDALRGAGFAVERLPSYGPGAPDTAGLPGLIFLLGRTVPAGSGSVGALAK